MAHLDADGNPTLSLFANDTSATAPGDARLTVRHIAAAPAVDIRADGNMLIEGLSNPDEASADVPAGAYSADVVLAGTQDVALGPADLDLAEGTHTIVYAWGSAGDQNLDLTVQTIDGLHSAPAGVPAGEAGLAPENGVVPAWALGLGLMSAPALVFAGRQTVTARSGRADGAPRGSAGLRLLPVRPSAGGGRHGFGGHRGPPRLPAARARPPGAAPRRADRRRGRGAHLGRPDDVVPGGAGGEVRPAGLPAKVFTRTGAPRLRLVTCGGAYDPERGGYQENLVITAAPVASD